MPEGPSIVILKELINPLLNGKKIYEARGNAKIDMSLLQGRKIKTIRSWGKQLFICLPETTIRIHFLLFGTYSIDEQTKPDRSLRLVLKTGKHAAYFYTCSVRLLEENIEGTYDWEADVMSDIWNPLKARKKLKALPDMMACDALLNQEIFAGSGNIIKNEVLYRIRLHPETLIKNIPPRKLGELIKEVRNYSFDFLRWKKEYTLKKHWLAHTKKTCLRCDLPFIKKYCGKTKRRTFFCENCQIHYTN
jgi:endonuclease-8